MQLNRISAAGLGQVFSRVFGLDDPNAVVNVAPEVMPTTSPWERDEFWALTGGNLCLGSQTVAAVAAQAPAIQLVNPVASGMIGILESFDVFYPVAAGVQTSYGMNTISGLSGGARVDNNAHRDARRAPNNNVLRAIAMEVRSLTSAALTIPTQGRLYHVTAGLQHTVRRTWIIPPGWAFQVATASLNLEITVTFEWREKPISAAEQLTY